MPKARTPKIKKAEKSETGYTLSVKNLGRMYHSSGNSLREAIDALQIKNPKGLSVWKIEHDGKIIDKIVFPAITFRLFSTHGTSREIALSSFLKMFSL